MTELMALDTLEQARLVREGEVSAVELVTAAIDAIEAHDGDVNAVTYRRFDQALDEARTVGRAAPFAGVPTLTKSMEPLAGAPAHLGSRWGERHGRMATADSPVIARLRRAGFLIVGQSASPEFGLVSTTESAIHGITRNPWDLDRTSGGSSGGASAAVSAGMVSMASGGDGGGSIRMPAAFCQLVGHKPSHGLVSGREAGGDRWGHSVPAVVTRTVRDTAAVLELLTDRRHRGSRLPALAHDDLLAATDRDPGLLRIGVVAHAPAYAPQVAADVADAVNATASLLETLGHTVDYAFPEPLFDPRVLEVFFDSLSVTVAQSVDALAHELGGPPADDDLDAVTRFWDERGRQLSGVQLAEALAWQQDYRQRMAGWWTDYDVLLSPVFATPAPLVSWPWKEDGGLQKSVDVLTFTAPFNTTGQPGISVPAGLTAAGLPLGVQLVAAHGRDDVLLQVARQLEVARPWESIAPGCRS